MNNKAEKPLVSIIIPTYKGSTTLARAIMSCLGQSYRPTEIIIVDDNDPKSTERYKTESIVKNYENLGNVKYIKHSKNRNGSAARNTGFKNSKGSYISLLDDDDYYDDNKVLEQVVYLEKNPHYMAATSTTYKNGRKVKLEKKEDYTLDILRAEGSPPTPSLMIRREAYQKLNGFDESYTRHQDYEFLLRFFCEYKMGMAEKSIIHICSDGTDNRPSAKELEQIKNKFLDQFEALISQLSDTNKVKRITHSAKYSHLLFAYLKERKFSDARRMLRAGFSVDGVHFIYEVIRYTLNFTKQKIRN